MIVNMESRRMDAQYGTCLEDMTVTKPSSKTAHDQQCPSGP